MSKDIWHTQKETPEDDRLIVVENYSGFISVGSEFEYDLDRVRKWAYFDDLLALETKLERTRKALDVAVDALKELKPQKAKGGGYWAVKSTDAIKLINTTLEQITALEQKE